MVSLRKQTERSLQEKKHKHCFYFFYLKIVFQTNYNVILFFMKWNKKNALPYEMVFFFSERKEEGRWWKSKTRLEREREKVLALS